MLTIIIQIIITDDKARLSYLTGRPEMSGGASSGSDDDDDADEMMKKWRDYLEMEREGGHKCEFPCGKIIIETLTTGDTPIDLSSDDVLSQ